jgi:pyrroline-5-carboxylate reductase
VKPQHLERALAVVDNVDTAKPLIISIVAGLKLARLSQLAGNSRVIRVMPNSPCLIRQGISAISFPETVSDSDAMIAQSYLQSVGKVVLVDESMLDSVTGLSGSGPAFVFHFIESLVDGAVLTGMPRQMALELAIQTVIGSTALLQQTEQHTAVLRDRVSSPGGTTIYGLKTLEAHGFRDAVMSAVQAATNRSRELATQ